MSRPRLPDAQRSVHRVVIRATNSLAEEIKLFAEYHGVTVQQITRTLWKRTIEKHPEFRVPQNIQTNNLLPR